MNIYWCGLCGFEDTVHHESCGSCGCALNEAQDAFLRESQGSEETVYELSVTSEQRAGLVAALIDESVRHRWDTAEELVVSTDQEETVDALLDDVLHEDVQITVEDDDEDFAGADFERSNTRYDDEDEIELLLARTENEHSAAHEAMDAAFSSSERLLKHWKPDDVGTFIGDATTISLMSSPLGVDEEEWAEVASLARNCAMRLQEDDQADVEPQVKELRNRLHAFL